MARITVEGSITPSVWLARGHRRTVEDTAYVRKLIRNGFVTLVDSPPAAVEVVQVVEEQLAAVKSEREVRTAEAPAKSASRDVWAAFLDKETVSYPEEAGRNDLIARWEYVTGQPSDR
jgi:hypothetical protein